MRYEVRSQTRDSECNSTLVVLDSIFLREDALNLLNDAAFEQILVTVHYSGAVPAPKFLPDAAPIDTDVNVFYSYPPCVRVGVVYQIKAM